MSSPQTRIARDTLMGRAGLAKALGVSVQEVNRRLRVGALVPASTRGTEPVFTYEQLEEQRLLSRKKIGGGGGSPSRPEEVQYSGQDASTVFKALGEGKTLKEIVVEHSIHPSVVEAASSAWARLGGGLYIGGNAMKAIERMPLDGEFPIQTDTEFVEMLKGAVEGASCERCKKKTRKVCLGCARSLARKGRDTQPSVPSEEVEPLDD